MGRDEKSYWYIITTKASPNIGLFLLDQTFADLLTSHKELVDGIDLSVDDPYYAMSRLGLN